jgi:hypothetical protein
MAQDIPEYRMPEEDRLEIQKIYSKTHLKTPHYLSEKFTNKLARRFFCSWCYDSREAGFPSPPSENYTGETFEKFVNEKQQSLRISKKEVLSRLTADTMDIFHEEQGSPEHMGKKSDIRYKILLPLHTQL